MQTIIYDVCWSPNLQDEAGGSWHLGVENFGTYLAANGDG